MKSVRWVETLTIIRITLVLKDKFRRLRLKTSPKKKEKWNIAEDQDWSKFKLDVLSHLPTIPQVRGMTVNALATAVSTALHSGGLTSIGFKPSLTKSTMKSRSLPNNIVRELQKKRDLESTWKTLRSSHMNNAANAADLTAAENAWENQKQKVSKLFAERRRVNNKKLLEDKHAFWSAVSGKVKQSADISAVLSDSGALKCDPDEIKIEVESHLCKVFQVLLNHSIIIQHVSLIIFRNRCMLHLKVTMLMQLTLSQFYLVLTILGTSTETLVTGLIASLQRKR